MTSGPQNVIYALFEQLPMASFISYVFILMVFLSFVTAADSNTSAMSAISTLGISVDNQEAPISIKITWGVIIGLLALIMITFSGIEGVKLISVIGGFPALFLLLLVFFGLLRLLFSSSSILK